MKILILPAETSDDFWKNKIVEYGIDCERLLKKTNVILRAIRRMHLSSVLPFKSLWYNNAWKKKINSYEGVVVFASRLSANVPKWIYKKNKKIRVIFWYSNPINKSVNPKKVFEKYCKKWSFDEQDCLKYNLQRNTQYFYKKILVQRNTIKYDVFFLGNEKGRGEILEKLAEEFISMGIKFYFHIVRDKTSSGKFEYKAPLKYEKVLDYISQSNAILEIMQNGQNGLTLRPLEALFLNKKLITNNSNIQFEDFYNKNNIFILGKDNIQELNVFLTLPIMKIDNKIIMKYDFSNWLRRFFEE